MTPSERIIVEIIRTYLMNPDVLVLDSLFSLLGFEYVNILISIINDMKGSRKPFFTLQRNGRMLLR